MPLSPTVRRERRAKAKRLEDPKIKRRKRCANCGELFEPTKPHKRFCKEACRKEFHHHGSAFGPLRDKLVKLVREITGQHAAELRELRKLWIETEARFVKLGGQVNELVNRLGRDATPLKR